MQFNSLSEFVSMGGYGFFVWISFGLSFFALILLTGWSFWHKQYLFKSAKLQLERAARIKAARKNAVVEQNDTAKTKLTDSQISE